MSISRGSVKRATKTLSREELSSLSSFCRMFGWKLSWRLRSPGLYLAILSSSAWEKYCA